MAAHRCSLSNHAVGCLQPVGRAVADIQGRSTCQAEPGRHGFTLVELLVVVVIITMLAGLMLPALIGARGRARMVQCANNQGEIGKAVLQYESAKQRMPGYVNRLGSFAVSWVPVLFPYLGRTDLWEDGGWRDILQAPADSNPRPPEVRVPQLVCPDADVSATCGLTYVVNVGTGYDATNQRNAFYIPANTASPYPTNTATSATPTVMLGPGVFRNMVPIAVDATTVVQPKALRISDIKATSQRPMLSERQYALPLSSGSGDPLADREWNKIARAASGNFSQTSLETAKLTPAQLGFPWQVYAQADSTLLTTCFVNTSVEGQKTTIHRGVVIVTFCDGHTENVSDDVQCNVYDSSVLP